MNELDLRGLRCPEPLIRVKLWLQQAPPDAETMLLLDDPGSRHDVPRYLTRQGHHCVVHTASPEQLLLWVRLCPKETKLHV